MSHRRHEIAKTPQRLPVGSTVVAVAGDGRARPAGPAVPLPAVLLTDWTLPVTPSGPAIPSQRRPPADRAPGAGASAPPVGRTSRITADRAAVRCYANAGPDVYWVVSTS